MPTRNRGKRSNDDKWFAEKWHPVFKDAVDDLCYLLTRGYTEHSALQVVGNRYRLNKRQRKAIMRISAGEEDIIARQKSNCHCRDLADQTVDIDGFNLLILLENALSGAYIFKARDNTYRDISGVHGSYRRVIQTEEAMLLTGLALQKLGVHSVNWYLDKPVSNSGMLKTKLMEISELHQFNWKVTLVSNPDKILVKSSNIVVSSDGAVLSKVGNWFNLGAYLIENCIEKANVIAV